MSRTVTIIYKSGAKARFRCKEFSFKRDGRGITEVKWDGAKPAPLHIGVDEIAAIYDGKA